MFSHIRAHRGAPVLLLLTIVLIALVAGSVSADATMTVTDVEYLGTVIVPTGTMFMDTEVGGISGLAYDSHRGVYYALSDDRSEINPARFYTLDINVADGSLDDGDVNFLDVTFLRDHEGQYFGNRALDPESIDMVNPGHLYISTEGDSDSDPVINPFVDRFNVAGKQNRSLPIPAKYLPNGLETFGVADNLGFESMSSTPNRRYLYVATENALAQDGNIATLDLESASRFMQYDLKSRQPGPEYLYCVEPVPAQGDFDVHDNGLVEIQALDNNGTFLAMERSFALGVGNIIRLFETTTSGATDVSDYDDLDVTGCETGGMVPMTKTLVADFTDDLGLDPDADLDNMEAMAFGPPLDDGRWLLIVVADNNFNDPWQETLFIALAVTVESS